MSSSINSTTDTLSIVPSLPFSAKNLTLKPTVVSIYTVYVPLPIQLPFVKKLPLPVVEPDKIVTPDWLVSFEFLLKILNLVPDVISWVHSSLYIPDVELGTTFVCIK